MRCLPLVVLALALPLSSVAAQESKPGPIGVFGGASVNRNQPQHLGLQFGAMLNVGLTPRVGMQFDLTYHRFQGTRSTYITPCLPPSAGSPACGPVTTVTPPNSVASATVNFRYAEQRVAGAAFYWLAGVGVYAVAQSLDGSYTRAGWNVGGGFRLGRSLFLDVRYHQLIRAQTIKSLVPVTFGVRL